MAQLGDMLKAAREDKGLTLAEVEEATHIRQHLIEALEQNNTKLFPSPVVARGMIRNYAKFLELNPIEALKLYDGNGVVPVKGQRITPNGIEFMNLSMAPRPLINWELVFGVMIGFVVFGTCGYLAYGTVFEPTSLIATATKTPRATGITEDAALLLPTTTPPPTNTPTPVPPTGTPTPVVYTGVHVQLVMQQSSWVQILADDVKVFEGIIQAGETPNWSGERRVAIRAGNGGGVEVWVNGQSRGLMGAEGQVVDQIWEKVDSPETVPTATTTPTFGAIPVATSTPGQ